MLLGRGSSQVVKYYGEVIRALRVYSALELMSFAGDGAPRADKLWQRGASTGFVTGADGGGEGEVAGNVALFFFSQGDVLEVKFGVFSPLFKVVGFLWFR